MKTMRSKKTKKKTTKQKKKVSDGGRQTFATKLKILATAFCRLRRLSLPSARARQWARSLVALFPCLLCSQLFPSYSVPNCSLLALFPIVPFSLVPKMKLEI
jgi:ribosomal protein L16/L10AE